MDENFKALDNEEPVLVEDDDKFLVEGTMFMCSQILRVMKRILYQHGDYTVKDKDKIERWFGEGVNCKSLKFGAKGWQKGKVRLRVSLEFCPDEPDVEETPISNQPEVSQPESPLDDIRRMINQETQENNQ